jgi:hypothetical protein
MVAEYFATMALLSLFYLGLRFIIVFSVRLPWVSSRHIEFDGKGLDATEIAERMRHVREHIAEAKTSPPGAAFKRALRVESARTQISGLAYFQKPPPAIEPPESEPVMNM